MKKITFVITIVILFVFFFVSVFPPYGQACPDFPGTKCRIHKESAFEFFVIRGGTFKDLIYIAKFNLEQKKKMEDLNEFLKAEKAKLTDLSLVEIREKLQNAINKNIQNETIGKYNNIPIVIQRSNETPAWNAMYANGEGVTEQKCSELGGNAIKISNSNFYQGCSPI